MTREQCEDLLFVIEQAYPERIQFGDEAIDLWYEMLCDLPVDIAAQAVRRLISTSTFVPSIAEIRREAAELIDPLPSVDDAYEQAREAARHFTPYADAPAVLSHPMIRQAVDAVGGLERMAYTDDPDRMARDFRQAYTRLREAEIQRRQTWQNAPVQLGAPISLAELENGGNRLDLA